jgi:hypothetical protein
MNDPTFFLRASMSVAFKVPSSNSEVYGDFSRPFGAGFNAILEVGWTWTSGLNREKCERDFKTFVSKIDHQHLGFDVPELGITTPESLLEVCAREVSANIVRFQRGEDIKMEFLAR